MIGTLATRRGVLAHVVVCQGCCCGQQAKGHPPVPEAWLRNEWKARRLLRRVHLTISGCLGPCDLANVVVILAEDGNVWLGGLGAPGHYEALLEWATAAAAQGRCPPLPAVLAGHRFERFDREAPSVA